MKKIVFIAGTLGKGGAERQLYYVCKLLKPKYKIVVLSLTSGEYYEKLIKELGVEIIFVGKNTNRFARLFHIIKETKKAKGDYIFSFHFYTNFYAAVAGFFLKTKSFGSIRSNGFLEKKSNGLFAWLHYGLPSTIVANSTHGINNAKKAFYKRKIIFLPNYIDIEHFNINHKKTQIPVLTFIGRFFDVKQPCLFVDIIRKLTKINFAVKAEMIGDGPLKKQLIESAQKLPIEFLGIKDDIRPFLAHSSYLISTSKNEGTPNVMLEAMASKIPILALYHEGLKNWIDIELIPKHNTVDEIVEYIQRNTPIRNNLKTSKGKEYVIKEHGKQKVLSVLEKIFH